MKNNFKEFLDTSTIHGLSWISSTTKYVRLVWTSVVIGGFSLAIILIQEAFYNWDQSPISTTVESLPISHLTFPNVTVCPPKNSFLNLNFDIEESKNIKLDDKTRDELYEYAMDVIQNEFFDELMSNLSKIEEKNRFHNWYKGYSAIKHPFFDMATNQLTYLVITNAPAGNISTKMFENRFDPNWVDGNLKVVVKINYPQSVFDLNESGENVSVTFNLKKNTLTEFKDDDKMTWKIGSKEEALDSFALYFNKTFSTKGVVPYILDVIYTNRIELDRKLSDMSDLEIQQMPGFRLTWSYDKQISEKSQDSIEAVEGLKDNFAR